MGGVRGRKESCVEILNVLEVKVRASCMFASRVLPMHARALSLMGRHGASISVWGT